MLRMKKLLCMLTVILLVISSSVALAATEYSFAIVNANKVNLREKPGGDIITRLDKGTCVYIAGSQTRGDKLWHQIIVSIRNNQEQRVGWMDASFLTDVCELYNDVAEASVGNRHVLLRMQDGSAASFGFPFKKNTDLTGWGAVTEIAAGRFASYGLSPDGKTMYSNDWQWHNEDLPLASLHTNSQYDSFTAIDASGALLNHNDPYLNGAWDYLLEEVLPSGKRLIDAAASVGLIAAIAEDHTLYVAAESDYFDAALDGNGVEGVLDVAIGGHNVYALMMDGTVRCFGKMDDEAVQRIESWSGVVEIAAGNGFVAALKEDGSVHFAGQMSDKNWNYRKETVDQWLNLEDAGRLDDWMNMTSIAAGDHILVGVTEDGHIRVTAYMTYD